MIIVDDFTRATWTFLLKTKAECVPVLHNFIKFVATQFNTNVKSIRSENAKEFCEGAILKFYHANGIYHQTICVETPQQNGRVERKHKHLLEVARALRFQSNLPMTFWGESIQCATYLIN